MEDIAGRYIYLSAYILKAVYYPFGEFMVAHLGSRPSRIWRSILDGREVLQQELICQIGIGETTNIWKMNWPPMNGSLRPVRFSDTPVP